MNEKPQLKSVSDLLSGATALYQKHFKVLVPIMLIAGIGGYLQIILMYVYRNDAVTTSTMYTYGGSPAATTGAGTGILGLIALIIYFVGILWGFSALMTRIQKIDHPMDIKTAFMSAKPLIWPLFVTALLVCIFTLIGFVLLIIPGIIVSVWASFAFYVVIEEHKSGMDAFKTSKAYVEGYWWPVFGRAILIGLMVGLVSAVLGFIATIILGQILGSLIQVIISLALTPLIILYQYDLYKNIKMIKSGTSATMMPPAAPVSTAAPTV